MAKLNHNVKLMLLFSFLQSFGRGIWLGNVISAYIFYLTDESYTILGYSSAAIGFAMTITVFPAGYFTDKFRRDTILKIAAILGFVGIALTALANSIAPLLVALVFWGIYQGLMRPSLEAIFADSVPSGNRSGIYSWVHLTRQIGMSVGPFLNVFLFMTFGDTWEISILKSVMFVGLAISGMSLLLLFSFDDNKTLSEAEAIVEINHEDESSKAIVNRKSSVPYLLIASNLIIGVGAGMTIRFFPIFFIKKYNFNPISVQIIFGLLFVLTGLSALITQKMSLQKGRPMMIFIVQNLAIICLFVIATYPPVYILVIAFLLRGSLMNSAQPLSRSILMDFVSKRNRGKWNSIEAIAWGLFWNLSAAIGGHLVENFGYQFTFITTGIVYIVGTLPILLIIPMVGKERELTPVIKSPVNAAVSKSN